MAGIGHRGFMGRKSGGFTPTDDFDFWFDFSTTDNLTLSGSDILTATDLTGNGFDASSVVGKRPTWGASKINGLGAALFNGSQFLSLNSYASQQNGINKPVTLFVVVKPNQTNQAAIMLSFGRLASNTPNKSFALDANAKYNAFLRSDSGVSANPVSTSLYTVTYILYRLRVYNVLTTPRIDSHYNGNNQGILNQSANIPSTMTFDTCTIGVWDRVTDVGFFNGEIAEIFFKTGEISDATRDAANLYLSNKYGIALTP